MPKCKTNATKCKGANLDIEDLRSSSYFTEEEIVSIRKGLLDWYDKNHRDLPWRQSPHSQHPTLEGQSEEKQAYSVWVSEMMLQQTRVTTVLQYYKRWMDKWPSLSEFAEATQEEVNTMWAGLGYYRRARFLLEGSKHIMENCNGIFPRSVTELQQIPGIGKYTAGAIASIAFKQPVPVVDGNVIRVLCRVRAISANPKQSTTSKLLWALAEQIVDSERPGDFNQALMELGAIVCTPTGPSCLDCPVANSCKALALEETGESSFSVTTFPVKTLKATPREEYAAVCVVELIQAPETGASFLLVQRPKDGLLAGLWEFPSVPLQGSSSSAKSRAEIMDEYLRKSLGLKVGIPEVREAVGTYTHVFSHIRLTMYVEWLQISSDDGVELNPHPKTRWVEVCDVVSLGLTSGVKKIFTMVSEHRKSPKEIPRKRKRRHS